MRCMGCGKEMFTSSTAGNNYCFECQTNKTNTGRPSNCDMPLPQGFGKQEGWICPVCGRGVAPWVDVCPCQSDWKITYGTATSINNDGNSQSTVTDINSEWNQYSTYTESEK